jgi:hypothetical protein
MSKAEAFEVKFAGNRSINVEVNFSKGDAIKVPVNINSMDADKLAQKIADQLQLPEIDTSAIAKQGNNPDATLTAIYKLLTGSEPDTPEIIPEGVEERLALILEFFGIKPIQAYEFMTAEEVCYELEEIMTTMDINLTPEKAKEITQQTLNN